MLRPPPSLSTMSDKTLRLDDHKAILVAHEQQYRDAKRQERSGVVSEIIQEIAAASHGGLSDETTKGLDKVSEST